MYKTTGLQNKRHNNISVILLIFKYSEVAYSQ